MKKVKWLLYVALVFILMPLVYVYGTEIEYAYETEIKIEPIVFTYEQALQIAIDNSLVAHDIDNQIRDMYLELRYMTLELEAQFFNSRPRIAMTEEAITSYTRRLRNRLLERERNTGISADSDIRRTNRAALHNLNKLERQIEYLHLQQQHTKLVVELMLREAIINLIDISLHIDVLREEHSLAEENLRRVILLHELGFVSTRELREAEHDLVQRYVGLEEFTRSYYIARQDLNHLLGQPILQYTKIELERVLAEIPQDLTPYIDKIILESITIRQSQLELDTAVGERWIYTGNNNDIRISESDRRRARTSIYNDPDITRIRNRIALQDNVERVILGHEQTMRTVEAAIYRGFADMEGLLALEAAHGRDLSQAHASLDIVIFNYRLGYYTWLDVAEAHLAVLQAEHNIEGIHNRMWVLSFMLDNPSLL